MSNEKQASSVIPLELSEEQKALPARKRDAHKGDFGHVLIVGGDLSMGGAVSLASSAALHAGAGLVSVATHKEHVEAVVSQQPEVMCKAVETTSDLKPLLERATVVVIGPGLGKSAWSKAMFSEVLESDLPLLLDADALNLLAQTNLKRDNWILTPHPGEAARLLEVSTQEIQADRVKAIKELKDKHGGVVVLKGAGSLVSAAGSHEIYMCEAGNPGMATAGMGDVLSGVIGALVAQKLSLEHAARLGVCVHAHAGDHASKFGERGILASDLFPHITELVNP